ncbi:MAG TPA: prepilin-type N-terminal cleavage/methylation domain-containing protein [Noviherbaspirillum sp.]|uniref:type II secretion system protein n=1 Tax=Noviherbaspirillum sp. TaxID=1926288 RepID=UPI002F93399B
MNDALTDGRRAATPYRPGRGSVMRVLRGARGFTLFELVIVICIVALFSAFLLDRLRLYQEMAEKAAMEQTAGSLRSALHLQMASLIAKGRMQDIEKLAEINPFSLLAERQGNYLGEYDAPPDGELASGSWYYDRQRREVVYLVHLRRHFVSADAAGDRVRYKVAVLYNDQLPPPLAAREVGGLSFREQAPYQWRIQ